MSSAAEQTHLRELLADPAPFAIEEMPQGQPYLGSETKARLDALLTMGILPVATLPTLAGAAAIKLIDKVDPIFTQTRVGRFGEPFKIHKLTTMPGMPEDTHSNGRHDDPRRSELGKFLSLLRIDESPQLFDVAKRKMSIIGPRPLLKVYLKDVRYLVGPKEADEWIKVRSLALPGIFDDYSNRYHGGEIHGDDAQQLRQRIELESAYILQTASVGEDLKVLGKTFSLFGRTVIKHLPPMRQISKFQNKENRL